MVKESLLLSFFKRNYSFTLWDWLLFFPTGVDVSCKSGRYSCYAVKPLILLNAFWYTWDIYNFIHVVVCLCVSTNFFIVIIQLFNWIRTITDTVNLNFGEVVYLLRFNILFIYKEINRTEQQAKPISILSLEMIDFASCSHHFFIPWLLVRTIIL